ncbi:Calx-beta domain-containing protein [uncultured Reyranella sp.]|uniref:beta strand repeat-containing protein n=1 Tax=uncultured Reyranella sp. TaxID=735512 RepID=UPI00259CC939|nr:Calx-beta domain-containing protein [uncultured Reyranella sp.]
MTSLVADLGGTAGFGEFSLSRNDDSSTGLIDLTPIFGAQGINFFGRYYTGFYLNNNGSVTFNAASSSFTPTAITGSTSNPVIAAYWADIDTRGGTVTPTPGGTSTGTNLLWYDLDSVTQTFTATWDDVGYYSSQTNKLNAFQLSLHKINAQGDFDITFRYENIDWTTGGASGGSNGLGGTPARAGYSAGNGVEYFELPQSGNQAALLDLENASNVGTPGTFVFAVRNGVPTVGVTAGDASVDEGNAGDARHVSIPVYLTEASTSTVTIHYATANGTAIAGEDYVSTNGILTFAPGVTQQNILVAVTGDAIVEGNETFTVTLSNPSDNASILDGSATGTIVNDDTDPASLSIAATSASKAEGQSGSSAFTFTVTRTGDLSGASSAQWAVAGAAVNGTDFTGNVLPSGTVSFAAGESSKVISVNVAGDTLVEADEAFSVTLSNASAGTVIGTASANGLIRNDDASLSIAATSASKAEGQSGSSAFTFTVTRTGDLSGASSAQWAVAGAAVNGTDFTGGVLPNGTVSFAAGESSKVISIAVAGDTTVETNEAFSVTLSNASAGTVIGTASANGNIRNDDASLSIAATSADNAEGQTGTSTFTFTVTRTGLLSGAASAHWAVSGAAVDGADFAGGVLPTGTVSFAAGESSKVISIAVAGDTLVESNEAFSVTLSSPSTGAVIGTSSANGLIRNDDASLSIAATSATKAEGQSGSSAFTFTVTRTGDLSGASSAQWAVSGAAVDGADFAGGVLPTGTVSFAAGESSKVISIAVAGDTLVESNEAFSVTLSNASAGTVIGTASANGLIQNDDAALSIAATSADKGEGDLGATPFTFTITRTGDLSGSTNVGWAVTGSDVFDADFIPSDALLGSADLLSQFASDLGPFFPQIPSEEDSGLPAFSLFGGVMPSGTVSFAAGETSKTVTVWVLGETLVERDESFQVTLSNASDGAVIDTASAVGTIRNDEHPDLVLSGVSYTLPGNVPNLLLIGTDHIDGTGNALSNILIGNTGDNTLSGLGDTDYLYGLDGNDILIGGAAGAAPNQLWGGDGTDTASYAGTTGNVYADLAALAGYVDGALVDAMNSIENLAGGSGTNTLVGNADANVLTGGAGIDYLYGQGGDDVLIGGAVPGGGTNQLWGGDGSDTASYATTTGVVYADLGVQAGWVGGVLVDHMNSIENLVGGSNADTLVGDAGANRLTGGAGADVLWGRGGADVFVFSSHADSNLVTGYDTIGDFVSGVSKLDLRAFATDASHVVIQSGGASTSVYVLQSPGHFDASTDAAIALVGHNAIAITDILFS